METTLTENQKNTSTFIHLSTFLKYFFPFANFIAPLLIWTFNREKAFVDEHGKQAINFQLSVLIYTLLIGLICLPFFIIFATDFISLLETIDHNAGAFSVNNIQNLSGYILLFGLAILLFLGLFIFELYAVINASIHASRGLLYQYPLSIPFIKTNLKNPIQNEHIS
ncbi:DUF4870 domain-containing protein [Aequorivita lipolytica]|uniref:DUF4870 domain-containing protein n=1 Tax=Aequorivita lipolytica TaxID=153267 RepID=A0A5C6YQD1_9FLAO|nr:DUF4870 domain-containing protein [Aequorivita lipolytica]TXD69578.1 DUF4870 domain-containing protein [Aequorivita lipolytica]SRX51062.1 hypothetical protein AEQU2_01542 [Aequorivita lipolytica]